jgi:hypothetical protein
MSPISTFWEKAVLVKCAATSFFINLDRQVVGVSKKCEALARKLIAADWFHCDTLGLKFPRYAFEIIDIERNVAQSAGLGRSNSPRPIRKGKQFDLILIPHTQVEFVRSPFPPFDVIDRESHFWKSLNHLEDGDLAFESGQLPTDAEMRTGTEGQVLVVQPFQIQAVGFLNCFGSRLAAPSMHKIVCRFGRIRETHRHNLLSQ